MGTRLPRGGAGTWHPSHISCPPAAQSECPLNHHRAPKEQHIGRVHLPEVHTRLCKVFGRIRQCADDHHGLFPPRRYKIGVVAPISRQTPTRSWPAWRRPSAFSPGYSVGIRCRSPLTRQVRGREHLRGLLATSSPSSGIVKSTRSAQEMADPTLYSRRPSWPIMPPGRRCRPTAGRRQPPSQARWTPAVPRWIPTSGDLPVASAVAASRCRLLPVRPAAAGRVNNHLDAESGVVAEQFSRTTRVPFSP